MTNRPLSHPLVRTFVVTAVTLIASVTVANAQAGTIQGTGTINSVDSAGHKVNITHKPIPELKWPAMKMDFGVASSVDLKSVQPGTQVEFQMSKNAKGAYEINAIQPAAQK